jgi:perosamine synthetase|tara:strand:- start:1147 stop:2253 length:1107 start_codon:yes stop_codon:yes gene_type:complete
MIPIFIPQLDKNAKKYVSKCIDTNWISSQGAYIRKFEKDLAKYNKVKYCVATSSCTTALHLAIKSLNIGKGDEVICPDLTFLAPANMIVQSGAKLKLIDINSETLAIDHNKIEKKITKNTKAIMVVHQFGHSADMDPIMKIARKCNLKVIEDNAESIGGTYKGKKLGTIGDVATLSFYANKIITSGEGGAVLTNSKKIAEKCYVLRDHGMSRTSDPIKRYTHIDLGYNYRMTNMQAAVGLSQLEIINKILKKRNTQMLLYKKHLSQISEIKVRSFKNWCLPVHWLTTITIHKKNLRNKLIYFLLKEGVDARPMINPVHQAYHFKKYFNNKDFKNSINISKNSLHLPSSTYLLPNQIKFICKKIKLFFK